MRQRITCLTMLVLILASGTWAAAPVLVATSPQHDVLTVELTTLWSRGGDDDDEVFFGIPNRVIADTDGRVLVLDDQLSQVHVFAPDGTYEGPVGREGDGPGEFRRPIGLMQLPTGDLAVGNQLQGRFERVTLDGTPRGTLHLGGGGPTEGILVLYGAACRGGTILAATTTSAFNQSTGHLDRVQSLSTYDTDGNHLADLCEARIAMDFTGRAPIREADVLRHFLLVSAVGPDGRVYAPHQRDRYLIDVFDRDGNLVRQIARPDFATPARDDRQWRRIHALADTWGRNGDIAINLDLADTELTIAGLFVDERGHLFVEHARSRHDLPDGVFLRLDEFGPDGQWLHELHLKGVGDPLMDTVAWLDQGRIALIRGGKLIDLERWRDAPVEWNDEAEVAPEVVVCRWGGPVTTAAATPHRTVAGRGAAH